MRAKTAYLVTHDVAFLPHPHIRGVWVRAHPSVLFASCPACRAKPQKLCKGSDGGVVLYTHYKRRKQDWRSKARFGALKILSILPRSKI